MSDSRYDNLDQRIALIVERLAREAQVINAAQRLARLDDYCDFFVENNDGGPFHEKCPDDVFLGLRVRREDFSQERMDALRQFRASADDDYPDFFVEGSGPPWHERVDDFGIREQLVRPEQRAFALRRSRVLEAFTRVAESVAQERSS